MTYCPRFIHTMYCDDVRQEIGGKMTFVGAYQSQMVAELPGELVLPKLCIVVTAQTPHDQPFKEMKVKLYHDDEVIQELDVPTAMDSTVAMEDEEGVNFHVVGIIITLQGLRFQKNSMLRVRMETGDEELSAPAFQVVLRKPLASESEIDGSGMH
ncbi:hypothetical protein GJV26_15910 [Massilia dura]|uniref:Uncharacterized protein n=1 Tax=Pseudoduganella dura TaxID=321982 RepID=A0A6I3XMT8_9BURK|nr:hypothetical protein [Pseudoduganella dura]MUI13928.1 hypothetical protein [Pseudoduganella dura]GGX99039.1 hypothetical protein GCM10007386_32460 [Pseudoduganella dura]